MDINIAGRHVAVTDAMREHAMERAEKLERAGWKIMRINVTLSFESDRQIAEVAATVSHHGECVAKAESHDMYVSIDQALAKVEKQIQKLGGRIKDRREGGRDKWAGTERTKSEEEE